ncbi:Dabb family protein [Streptomyces tubercidicus]|uniref:Dabb family protein n=1 Tax=Streptomyces tubercidicus TaxID=47759 RepID=UPI002E15FFDA|nr:Dabb family protein [Streptomyces tubercidicus]WSX24189.1 Dabb family protein [Streptomyces tubercidicus]
MLRHVVLFKLSPGVDWDDPRAQRAEVATRNHPQHIAEILSWECGRNTADRPIAYDFALCGTFSDADAVNRYLRHPDHVSGVDLWRAIATWVVVDYEVAA